MASQSTSGHGIARAQDGAAVLIEGGIAAERVRVRVERRRGRPYGVLQEVLEPSPWRRTPPCPYASTCGGCDLMHIDDEQQLPLQRRALAELLSRKLPSIELPEIKTHRMPPLRYRQRARLAAVAKGEQVQIGYRRKRGHEVVAIDDCLVLQEPLVEAIAPLRALLSGSRGRGEIAVALGAEQRVAIALRWDGALAPSAFRVADRQVRERRWAGVQIWQQDVRTPATFGDARPSFAAADGQAIHIAPGGFAQPSAQAGRTIAAIVRRLIGPAVPGHLVELFAGSGTLTVALADAAPKLTCVEQDAPALSQLRENLKQRGVTLTTKQADANAYAIPRSCHTLVLDPPRAGAAGAMKHALAARVKQIVYVACDPSALARDLRALTDAGYVLTDIELVAMFPQTHHFETVVRAARA